MTRDRWLLLFKGLWTYHRTAVIGVAAGAAGSVALAGWGLSALAPCSGGCPISRLLSAGCHRSARSHHGAHHGAGHGADQRAGLAAGRKQPGRAILNRPWFDRLPEKGRDPLHLYVFFGGGVGVYEHGSRYRIDKLDVFELERRNKTLDIRFFQDGAKASTRFEVERCDDRPPFDLCLTLSGSPRGPKRFYSFSSAEDQAAHVPWARQLVRAARASARR